MSGDQLLSKTITFSSNTYFAGKKLISSHLTSAVNRNVLLFYDICVGNNCQGVQTLESWESWDLTLAEGHVIDISTARVCPSHFKIQLDFILPYLWLSFLQESSHPGGILI